MQPKFAAGFEGDVEPTDRQLAAGDVLFAQGDPPDFIYVIESGALEVTRTSPSGEQVVLAQLGPGEFVGEMGPLFGLPRSATVRATDATSLTGHSTTSFRESLGVDSLNDVIAGRR